MRLFAAIGAVLLMILVSGCATIKPHETSSSIGPYQSFTGRLIVIEPNRRWQVVIHWNGQPERGEVRLTHAASNRIVLLSWEGESMRMTDNQSPISGWRHIDSDMLRKMGIILPPQQLAMIFSGRIPSTLKEQGPNLWRGVIDKSQIRLKWIDQRKRLEITDITHGREAILMINS